MRRKERGEIGLSPSDLTTFVECTHATRLDLAAVQAGQSPPRSYGAFARLLAEKGDEHEQTHLAAYSAGLGTRGEEVFDVSAAKGWPARIARTREAMVRGEPLIYQASFEVRDWLGAADFLERVATADGRWTYEPVDTKLARSDAKPHHVMQLAWYADAIANVLEGRRPAHVHVALGSGRRETIRIDEVDAYVRRQRSRLERFVAAPTGTEAYPCAHCSLCGHRPTCESDWRGRDHLSYVAGIRRAQVDALRAAGVPTLAGLAALEPGTTVQGLQAETLTSLVEQAALQVSTRCGDGAIDWRHRPPHPARGFALLPEASAGDIFLDLEGDPVWEADAELVFLFGYLVGEGDAWRYQALWAHTPNEERDALERLVDVIERAHAADTAMRVYHYSHAEPSMLERIAERHRTCEERLDVLLRERVFVDLFKVVQQGLQVGLESYGLKSIERLTGFERRADVEGGDEAVVLYERWRKDRSEEKLSDIAAYNEEDCRATETLAVWLREHRPPDAPPEPELEEIELTLRQQHANAERLRRESKAQALRELGGDGSIERLLAELLVYHAREGRASGREYHELLSLPAERRHDDGRMLHGLTGDPGDFEVVERRYPWARYALTFPEQEHKIEPGGAIDPDSGAAVTVIRVDERTHRIEIERKHDPDALPAPLPRSLFVSDFFDTLGKERAIERVADAVLGHEDQLLPVRDLLACERPRIAGLPPGAVVDVPRTADADAAESGRWLDEVLARANGLAGGVLTIQGPPGTGKTWLAGRIASTLIANGKTVAVTAQAHKAIDRLLEEIVAASKTQKVAIRGERYASAGGSATFPGIVNVTSADRWHRKLEDDDLNLVAGTAFQLCKSDLDAKVDVLIVDEAGQYALADAAAAATSARKGVILVGDPLQLPQVNQASHLEGAGRSVLEHVLGSEPLIAPDAGVLLTVTRRMHPDVCRFISETIYEGKLTSLPECALQNTDIGTGIRFVEAEHRDRASRAPEEAAIIKHRALELLDSYWTDRSGNRTRLESTDLLVVTPYNAQRRCISWELQAAGDRVGAIRVGTVDLFQGQEAPIVLISLATSSGDDVPRGIEFLFSRNRLNVAVSRAQCLAIVVANPQLLDSKARTIDQMRLISTLCALREAAPYQENSPRLERDTAPAG